MIQSFRISKYDPQFRSPSGAYTRDEWTSISDVGGVFGGQSLSLDEYLAVESLYLDAIEILMKGAGVESLVVAGIELNEDTVLDPEVSECRGDLIDGVRLDRSAVRRVSRLVLRELVWCRLVGADGFYVHFGYDYYMYIGGAFASTAQPQVPGLFVEKFESPYHEVAGCDQ